MRDGVMCDPGTHGHEAPHGREWVEERHERASPAGQARTRFCRLERDRRVQRTQNRAWNDPSTAPLGPAADGSEESVPLVEVELVVRPKPFRELLDLLPGKGS